MKSEDLITCHRKFTNYYRMKKIALIIAAISLSVGVSCSDRKPVFEKYFKFENSNWDRFKKVVFNIPIEPSEEGYDITLVLKPNKDFIYNSLPVYVIMNTPSGEERMNDIKIQVKDEGKFIGEVEGQPVIIKTALWKGLRISEKGTCVISLENIVPKIQTAGLNEIGIIIEHAVQK